MAMTWVICVAYMSVMLATMPSSGFSYFRTSELGLGALELGIDRRLLIYRSLTGVSDPVLGSRGIRTLLAFRGLSGYVGVIRACKAKNIDGPRIHPQGLLASLGPIMRCSTSRCRMPRCSRSSHRCALRSPVRFCSRRI